VLFAKSFLAALGTAECEAALTAEDCWISAEAALSLTVLWQNWHHHRWLARALGNHHIIQRALWSSRNLGASSIRSTHKLLALGNDHQSLGAIGLRSHNHLLVRPITNDDNLMARAYWDILLARVLRIILSPLWNRLLLLAKLWKWLLPLWTRLLRNN